MSPASHVTIAKTADALAVRLAHCISSPEEICRMSRLASSPESEVSNSRMSVTSRDGARFGARTCRVLHNPPYTHRDSGRYKIGMGIALTEWASEAGGVISIHRE